MENVKVEVQRGNHIYRDGVELHGTAYEEFLRWAPNRMYLGADLWNDMFKDAVRSVVLNSDSIQDNDLANKVDEIVVASIKYSKIYFQSGEDCRDRALFIFHGVLRDIIYGYTYKDTRLDFLVEGLYKKIVDLIRI